MFKWTKKIASNATDGAIESVKKTIDEKIGPHIDLIQIGLAFSVIAIGTHILKKRSNVAQSYIPQGLPSGQPIIVNNYYREREDAYGQRSSKFCYLENGRQVCKTPRKAYSKR